MKKNLFFLIIFTAFNSYGINIGLCIMATGKYISYAQCLILSAQKYFMNGHNVHYFVFSDGNFTITLENASLIYQARLGWPFDTMHRFHVYLAHKDLFQDLDYVFALDADMLFVNNVGDEILSERVGTQHPGFVGKRGTYETSPVSKAYVKSNEGKFYFAGGFYGGSRDEFINLLEVCSKKVDADLQKNFIAIWHDESHLNRYFIDNAPTKILSPSYCYPENWHIPYVKKLLALDKNHGEMRK